MDEYPSPFPLVGLTLGQVIHCPPELPEDPASVSLSSHLLDTRAAFLFTASFPAALVTWECHNERPQSGWLRTAKTCSSQFRSLEV